jgi:hypothetical protein
MDSREREGPGADKPVLMILAKRAIILLISICAISLFFWVVGSESSFLDETQAMLLTIMRYSSLGVVVAAVLGILVTAVMAMIRRYAFRPLGIVGYVLALSLGAVALVLAQSVTFLSQGLR